MHALLRKVCRWLKSKIEDKQEIRIANFFSYNFMQNKYILCPSARQSTYLAAVPVYFNLDDVEQASQSI